MTSSTSTPTSLSRRISGSSRAPAKFKGEVMHTARDAYNHDAWAVLRSPLGISTPASRCWSAAAKSSASPASPWTPRRRPCEPSLADAKWDRFWATSKTGRCQWISTSAPPPLRRWSPIGGPTGPENGVFASYMSASLFLGRLPASPVAAPGIAQQCRSDVAVRRVGNPAQDPGSQRGAVRPWRSESGEGRPLALRRPADPRQGGCRWRTLRRTV